MRGGSGAHLMALWLAGQGTACPAMRLGLFRLRRVFPFALTSPKDSLDMSTDESVKYTFCFLPN